MSNSMQQCYANIQQRWILELMCFSGLICLFAMRGCLSIAITEMVLPTATHGKIMADDTCPSMEVKSDSNDSVILTSSKGTYEWSEYTQGLILSSFYFGYLIAHLPGGMIAEKFGGKLTMGLSILLTAIFTLLTPLAIYLGDSTALIVFRACMGLCGGSAFPSINVLLAQWTPPEERSRSVSFVYAGIMVGTIFTTTVSGWILQYSEMGWPLTFYVMGGMSVIWFLVWLAVCYNNPRENPFISQKELDYLRQRMSEHTHEKPPPVPWRHLIKSKPLWAVIIGLTGYDWAVLSLITDLPKYMSGVLKFSVENNGYVSSLIFLCMCIGSNASSWLADFFIATNKASITQVRKAGSIFALTVSVSFIVVASYAGCDRALVVGFFIASVMIMGTGFPSIVANALDLSPNYAGVISALTNGLSSAVGGFFGPYVIGILTPNQTLLEWRMVYWIMFGVAIISNVIYLMWVSGDVEYWNDPDFVMKEINERKRRKTARATI